MSEEMSTGVESTTAAAAEQATDTTETTGATENTDTQATESQNSTESSEQNTGENKQSAAGTSKDDRVEKAFAARLNAALEKERQKTRDAYIAEQNYEWNGKPIKTETEYKQALYEAELKEKGTDPETVKKLVEEHPDVKAAREYRENAEKQRRLNEEYGEFLAEFPDVDVQKIPVEVWQEQQQGKRLADAYARYLIKSQRTEAEKAKANEKNAKASMGSVGSQGNTDESFISKETFEAKKNDRSWVIKNLSKITASRAKW